MTTEDCALFELELTGGKYTWEKSRGTLNWVRERLDRAFATDNWWRLFPLCNLSVHYTICSDHPIQLDLCNMSHSKIKLDFVLKILGYRRSRFMLKFALIVGVYLLCIFLSKLIDVSSFMQKWGKNFLNKF